MNTPMNSLNTQIYEEASEWMILHRSDELDAAAKQRFDAWLRESPQHLKAYLEISTIWEDVPTLNREWNPSADQLIARAREDSNVFPLDVERVPGSGGAGVSGLSCEVADELPLQTLKDLGPLKDLEPLVALKALNEVEESTSQAVGPGTETFGGIGTVPAGQAGEQSRANAAHTFMEPRLQRVPVVTVPASQSSLTKVLAIAATLILTIGISGWFYVQRNTYTTDTGEQLTIALLDGSAIQLNAQSKVRVRYSDQERSIDLLQGQALFKVAKDPNRPFIVESDETRVRAVGTQFDVYKRNTGTQITVVEGRVAVATSSHAQATNGDSPTITENADPGIAGGARDAKRRGATTRGEVTNASANSHAHLGEVILSAGEQILIAQAGPTPELAIPAPDTRTVTTTPETPTPAPVKANVEAATAWTQQRLIFDFTPLTEVAQEFNRYNRRPMKVECSTFGTDPTTPKPTTRAPVGAAAVGDPCNFNISGSFSSTDPRLLLRFLREQPGIVVEETPGEIRISRAQQDANASAG